MDGYPRKLLSLIPKEREWCLRRDHEEKKRSHGGFTEEEKLELRLGPPGANEDCWPKKNTATRNNKSNSSIKKERDDESLLSLGHFPSSTAKNTEKKPFSPPSPATTNPAVVVPHSSQKRTAPGPVVGWPPVRSFRKNLASTSSSKPATESPNAVQNKAEAAAAVQKSDIEPKRKSTFVKINMDGVPIGRKVDLNAYDSYEKLSTTVDELFRGLLAAQRDSSPASGISNKQEPEKPITGLLDGNGEYTLVYEDNEGDRMLVGDVPWHMFVSTVKRLRVLKSSELSALTLGSSKPEKFTT